MDIAIIYYFIFVSVSGILNILILPEKLLERFNFADFWGIAGKKISGFEVVNIPSLFGDYYVIPKGIFLVTVIWFIICTILVIYYYGTYFL